MTLYQASVADHMATAPKELRDYVCTKLFPSPLWCEGLNPITQVCEEWGESEEGHDFWPHISKKRWEKAMATEFWQSYIRKKEAKEKAFIEPPIEYLEYVTKMWNQKGERWRDYEKDMENIAELLIHNYHDKCLGSFTELVVDLLRLCRMSGVPFGLASEPHNSRDAEGRLNEKDLQWAKSAIENIKPKK